MEWLASNGEIYHRTCVRWTASLDVGKCEECGEAIPDTMLRLARSQRDDRDRKARNRQVERSLQSMTQRFNEMKKKTDANLRTASDDVKKR